MKVLFGTTMVFRVFWLNIAKSGVYLRYRHCFKLFRELRKESEFQQRYCRNSTKVWERKRKSGREKILNFDNHITEILVAQTCWPKTNCGNAIAKIGEKKFCGNCGNAIAENRRKKKIMVAKIWGGIKKKCYVHNIFTIFSQQIIGD